MTIGERIKERRMNLHISQIDFAIQINVSKQTLYKYENDIITNIPSDKIELMSKVLNVSPAYIMGWDDPMLTEEVKVIELLQKHFGKDAVKLLQEFQELNQIGKEKLLENLDDLMQISKYTEKGETHALKNA